MTKLPRAFVALLPLAALLVACTPAADEGAPTAVPTFSPTPSASPELPGGRDIEEWAAEALPSDRAGGPSAVQRGAGALDTSPAASIDIEQQPGIWDLLLTCQSENASPITYELVSPTSAVDGPTELACTSPDGRGTPSTAIIAYEGVDATLELASTTDAVFAYEVRPHDTPDD